MMCMGGKWGGMVFPSHRLPGGRGPGLGPAATPTTAAFTCMSAARARRPHGEDRRNLRLVARHCRWLSGVHCSGSISQGVEGHNASMARSTAQRVAVYVHRPCCALSIAVHSTLLCTGRPPGPSPYRETEIPPVATVNKNMTLIVLRFSGYLQCYSTAYIAR